METAVSNSLDRRIADKEKDIPGWGIDANPDNNPTYPMKYYTGDDHRRMDYIKAPQQPQTVEILKTIERPTVSRVFGTPNPPHGLSGMLRRYAFKFSEGHALHWMTLILADRVNAIEGIVDDLQHGHVPNILKERGWNAEWKYNRKNAIKKIAISAGVSAAVVAYVIYSNRKKTVEYS